MDSPWIAGVGLSSRCPVRGSDSEGQRFTSGSSRAGGSSSPEHGRQPVRKPQALPLRYLID